MKLKLNKTQAELLRTILYEANVSEYPAKDALELSDVYERLHAKVNKRKLEKLG